MDQGSAPKHCPSSRDAMWAYGYGLKSHRSPPLSRKYEGLTQFSTPGDCHLLSDCCLPTISLYKMDNLSFTSTPSMSDFSTASIDEEAASSNPMKHAKGSAATVKTAHVTSHQLYFCCRRLHLHSGTLEVPQCLPAPEDGNSLVL